MHEKLPIQIRFELDELAAIDSYRRTQANPPTAPFAGRLEICRATFRTNDGERG
jgi:hypothetical protein